MKDFKEQVIEFYNERDRNSAPSKVDLAKRIHEMASDLKEKFDYELREQVYNQLASIAIDCILLANEFNIDLNDTLTEKIRIREGMPYHHEIVNLKAERKKLVKYIKRIYNCQHSLLSNIWINSLYLVNCSTSAGEKSLSKIAYVKKQYGPLYEPSKFLFGNMLVSRENEINNDLTNIYLNCILFAYSMSTSLDDIVLNKLEQDKKENSDVIPHQLRKELPHQ